MNRVIFLLTLLCTLNSGQLYGQETLFVYVPSHLKAIFLEEKIKQSCPEYDVRVFGKSEEFRQQLSEQSPRAVLSLPLVFESLPNLQAYTQGNRDGQLKERAVLLSLDSPVQINNIGKLRLGLIDLLGRKKTQDYINGLFRENVQIVRVTKLEDLAPLILFNMADAIFTSESVAQRIKQRSKLNLIETTLSIELGLAVGGELSNQTASGRQVFRCVQEFDDQLNDIFGVEHWTILESD